MRRCTVWINSVKTIWIFNMAISDNFDQTENGTKGNCVKISIVFLEGIN